MKFSDNLKQAQAIVELYAKLAYSIYVPFFTEDEVTRILKGEDFYVTSEDMAERVLRVLGGEDSDEVEES
jgi:hypothetical protein